MVLFGIEWKGEGKGRREGKGRTRLGFSLGF